MFGYNSKLMELILLCIEAANIKTAPPTFICWPSNLLLIVDDVFREYMSRHERLTSDDKLVNGESDWNYEFNGESDAKRSK